MPKLDSVDFFFKSNGTVYNKHHLLENEWTEELIFIVVIFIRGKSTW